ncbi:hypothetical protein like AT4G29090 [Hibiscus trionum]|uniref:Reverse transcriptase zinc-binding domain-containing protein n=1 Tax=Hibiscus trionum TaxID=183268 RepID=A0A9W7GYG3_HIBTR|nr:hypothetical protein like AT4G29090 [Hibiscus trionum]
MGFRDFRAFNRALLAKQGWRLIQNLNALWAQLLRGLYFPNGDVFTAKRGNNPSWAWLSIVDGIDTIKKGSRWNLKNGKNICIWDDRWIPSLPDFKVKSERSSNNETLLASHLINPDTREWKIDKLNSLFF